MRLNRLTRLCAFCAAAAASFGCGSDPTAPFEHDKILSAEEQLALQEALNGSGALQGLGSHADLVLKQLGVVGTTNVRVEGSNADSIAFDLVGIQTDFRFTVNGVPFRLTYTGLLAWTGLNVASRTVDEVITILAFGLLTTGAVDLGTVDAQLQTGGLAGVVRMSDTTLFTADNGSFALTDVSFGAAGACVGGSSGCSAAAGRMSGSFMFDASSLEVTGVQSRSATFDDMPSVALTLFVS